MVAEARGLRAAAGGALPLDGGTDDAFLPLARQCFVAEGSDRTTLRVCPFRNATQSKGGRQVALLGSRWAWAERDVRMALTDGAACPNRARRSAELAFECAAESGVLAFAEPEMCRYAVRFGTPAACPAALR